MDVKSAYEKLAAAIGNRLTYRMIAILVSCFAVISLLIFALIFRLSNRFERTEKAAVIAKGELLTASLSDKGNIGIAVGSGDLLQEPTAQIAQDTSVVYIIFYNQKGSEIIYEYPENVEQDFDEFPPLQKNLKPVATETTSINGEWVMDISRAVKLQLKKQAPASEESLPDPDQESAPGDSVEPPPASGDSVEKNPEPANELDESSIIGWIRVGILTQPIHNTISSILNIGYLVMALLVVMGTIITAFLRQMIIKPVLIVADTAKKFGRGELKAKIEVKSQDEVGELANAFNEMAHNIENQMENTKMIVENLSATIDLISRTTADMYAISAQQSSGATEQAASVFEASSTSKEIAASATRIADTAEEVASYARQTTSASDQGKVELANAIFQVKDMSSKSEELAQRMVELGAKSQKISGIIEIINEISEQTNLLALNAAIEAAGAGDAGKRFAVVAQEIRRLAGRTLESTQIVRQIVEEIQSATNTAVMVTEQSTKSSLEAQLIIDRMNQSFQNILDMVEQTLKASTEINLSTRQQTTACEQMVSTIMEVSEVASEVEKGAKETEKAMQTLRELSNQLKNISQSGLAGNSSRED